MRKRELLERIEKLEAEVERLRADLDWHRAWRPGWYVPHFWGPPWRGTWNGTRFVDCSSETVTNVPDNGEVWYTTAATFDPSIQQFSLTID